MAADEHEYDAVVLEALPNAMYRVELAGGQKAVAHIGGAARMNIVRILPGDRVRVALSPYDRTRGRITRRCR